LHRLQSVQSNVSTTESHQFRAKSPVFQSYSVQLSDNITELNSNVGHGGHRMFDRKISLPALTNTPVPQMEVREVKC